MAKGDDTGPGPSELPPPFGSGPAVSDQTVRTSVATGGWNHLTHAFAHSVPLSLHNAALLTKATRNGLGKR